MRYRYFCCGVIFTSVSWAILLVIYTTHLETESKNSYIEQRRMIRGQLQAAETDDAKDRVDDKAAWDAHFKQGGIEGLKKKGENARLLEKKTSDDDDNDVVVFNRNVNPNSIRDEEQRLSLKIAEKAKIDGSPSTTQLAHSIVAAAATEEEHIDSINRQVPMPPQKLNLDELAIIKTPEDQKLRESGYNHFAFNLLVSDRIGVRRNVPDIRHKLCKSQVYPSELPKASIIICFYNEAQSTLLRMLYSLLDRTPLNLIHEILIINDHSDDRTTFLEAQKYTEQNGWPKMIQFLETPKREGLIRAKIFGANKATGEVLLFLDSHCEVNTHWLEPLLTRLKERPHSVVCPIIDIIDPDTFKYVEAPVCMGGFNWGLHFKWDYPSWSYFKTDYDHIKPLRSPTMAGGLFAVRKEYFHYLGEYDPGMDIWGAENVEISFRIWMCGGELEIMPCSRVGHIFRKRRPYGSPDNVDTMAKNSVRAARVWLDEFQERFFHTRPGLKDMDVGNITDRLALREQLKCKTFRWYLENVYPELLPAGDNGSRAAAVPADGQMNSRYIKPKEVGKYLLRLSLTNYCLSTGEGEFSRKGAAINLDTCNSRSKFQTWHLSETGELRLRGLLCMDSYKNLRLMKCDGQESYQQWKQMDQKMFNAASGKCITAIKHKQILQVQMDICTNSTMGHWDFVSVSD